MATKGIIVIPPFIKYSAWPLLGPALLQSAALSRGHQCSIIDLNAEYISPRVSKRLVVGNFVGDHDKPLGPRSLSAVEKEFMDNHIIPALRQSSTFTDAGRMGSKESLRRATYGFLTNDQVSEASSILAGQKFGSWVKDIMSKQAISPPNVIGVSLLHSGQVIPAAAVTRIARQLWPSSLVVWGGPHISGLGQQVLRKDILERAFAADIFVTGHAEDTFVSILDGAQVTPSPGSPTVLGGKSTVVSPTFDNLYLYDTPLTFPAQSSIGCSYGQCSFCTYPGIEGTPQKLELDVSVASVIDQAQKLPGTTVSLKDSLIAPNRLIEVGDFIQNRVKWSACTKLSTRLDSTRLNRLARSGLSTLEVGLETLLPESQRMIKKIQPLSMYEDFLANVGSIPSNHCLSIVVNYIIGFPWEDNEASRSKLHEATHLLRAYLGGNGVIELNEFELERLAPMAMFPEAYGIDSTSIKSWPWASVLEWKKTRDRWANRP